MIRNFIYYIILLNILIISCNKKDDKNSKTNIRLKRLNVNIDDIPKTTLNELCPTIDLIPLESKKNVLLTNALHLEVDFYQDKIYIFDREQRDCLFIYNRDGKFIKKFSKQGRGPGEYMGISDFEINPFNNNLEILQADGQYYTYDSSGNFLSKVSILNDSIRATHKFANVSEDIVVFYTMAMNNRLIFYSKKESKIIRHIFKVPESTIENTNLRMVHKPFTRWKGMLFFHEIFLNDIYKVTEDTVQRYLNWDFGNYNFRIDKIPKDNTYQENLKFLYEQNRWVVSKMFPLESTNYYFVNAFINRNETYSVAYNKMNGSISLIPGSMSLQSHYLFFRYILPQGNGAVSLIDAYQIKEAMKSVTLTSENQTILNNINESQNPVIVEYIFK